MSKTDTFKKGIDYLLSKYQQAYPTAGLSAAEEYCISTLVGFFDDPVSKQTEFTRQDDLRFKMLDLTFDDYRDELLRAAVFCQAYYKASRYSLYLGKEIDGNMPLEQLVAGITNNITDENNIARLYNLIMTDKLLRIVLTRILVICARDTNNYFNSEVRDNTFRDSTISKKISCLDYYYAKWCNNSGSYGDTTSLIQ